VRFSLRDSSREPDGGGAEGKLKVEDAAFESTFRFGALRNAWRFLARGFRRARTRFPTAGSATFERGFDASGRSGPDDVSAPGVGPLVDLRAGEFHLAVASGIHSPYQGPRSLSPQAQDATSRVLTAFTGVRLTKTTELLCDVQETGGHGIGEAVGLGGVTNLDIVRNPDLSKAPISRD